MTNENHFCTYCGAAVGTLDNICIVCKNPVQGTAAPPRENPEASEAGGAGAEPHPPLSPQTIQYPSISLANAIRRHLKQRGIWQTIEGRFAVNDEVSRQVRRDTLRFRIEEKYWLGV